MKKMFTSSKNFIEALIFHLQCISVSNSPSHTFILATCVFLFMLIYTLQRSYNPFVQDSAYYWGLANSFIIDEHFSFTNFNSELRGYVFPFSLFMIKTLAEMVQSNEKTLFYVFSSLLFTLLSIFILPWFVHTLFQWKTKLLGKGVLTFALFFFWRGYFLYPLSDFPALASLLIGVVLYSKSLQNPSKLILSVLSGFFLSVALNIRPVYLVSFIILLAAALFFLRKCEKMQLFQWLLTFVIGCSIILLPQYLINKKHYQKNTPLVQARYADESLYIKELFWGIGTQKFETNIGDNFPSSVVIYNDPFKLKFNKTNLLREKSLSSYLKIARRFPIDMVVSYFRHLFNGLDIYFPTPYIKNIFANHMILSITNYLIWLYVIIHLAKTNLTRIMFIQIIGILSILAPVLLAIPTAVEVRYFLSAHILAYLVIAFRFNLRPLIESVRQSPWNLLRFAIVCTFWVILCLSMSSTTAENLVY